MKKKYIQPLAKAYNIQTESVIATSPTSIPYSGSNKGNGPTAADSKGGFFDDEEYNDEW